MALPACLSAGNCARNASAGNACIIASRSIGVDCDDTGARRRPLCEFRPPALRAKLGAVTEQGCDQCIDILFGVVEMKRCAQVVVAERSYDILLRQPAEQLRDM